jgi:predicted transposase/invertase (TIGR01784 family)
MPKERTLVSFDWAIKNLLRKKADYVILEGFLTTLLSKKIKIKNLTDSESNRNVPSDRINRVDVLAEEDDGALIIIEIQFTPEIDYFHRMLFGSSKAIVEHLGEGISYSKVKKVYSINVVYFDLGSGKDYIYHGTTTFMGLHCKDELKLSPKQRAEFAKLEVKDIYPEFYLLKVDRFRNIVKNKLDEWMYFFKNSSIKSNFKAPGLDKANEKLEYHRLSAEERRAYDWYVDNRRSNDSTIYTAKLEGLAEGKAEGLAEGKAEGKAEGLAEGELIGEARGVEKGMAEGILQTAKKMKSEGISVDIILKVTGLSKKEAGRL